MKFCRTKLQLPPEPLTKGLPAPDPRSLCPLSSTVFGDPHPPRTKFLGTPLVVIYLHNVTYHKPIIFTSACVFMCKSIRKNRNSTTNSEHTTDKPVRQVSTSLSSVLSILRCQHLFLHFRLLISLSPAFTYISASPLPPLTFQPPYICVHNHKQELLILLDPLQPHSSEKSPQRKKYRKEAIYRLGLHCRVSSFRIERCNYVRM